MSKLVKGLVSVAVLSFTMSAFAADVAATTTSPSTVDTACASEMTTSGCTNHEMGKCFHDYKKKHHDFKVSDGCKKAMKEAHEMKKEEKKSS